MQINWMFWGRNTGKTQFLVEACRQDPDAVLVTFNRREAKRIVDQYQLDPSQVLAVADVRDGIRWRHSRNTRLLVDNLDLMLSELFSAPVSYISLSKEDSRFVKENEKF